MKRKEIIVAGKVFDLGLKGLEAAQNSCRVVGQEMELEVGDRVFSVGVSMQERAFVMQWTGDTGLANVYWMRFLAVGPWWPPVKNLTCFAEL